MAASTTIQLHIGNAIPPADVSNTEQIIALWQQIGSFFRDRSFQAQSGIKGAAKGYTITLDSSALENTMKSARDQSQSFRENSFFYTTDTDKRIDGGLAITVTAKEQKLEELEVFNVATVFLQQLVMLTNIIHPGSFQVLDARFTGDGAHRYEAQQFDARIFHGALRAARSNHWPVLHTPALETVWTWLEKSAVARTDIAIQNINRVLFTLLKVAEQRHEYSARTVLLVTYQLEVLLNCRELRSLEQLRNRAQLVLGMTPEAADCFTELHDVRNSLFLANQPVHRPPMICYNTAAALREQIGQHTTAVESGTAIVLALLQDLIAHNAQSYSFRESLSRE
ncbi:MAG: hypothetical protein EA349_04395 [Halomonadaceae bacterium]|nr:MAG: hypothetical protein EA349_04395 [Halomonadaceae bacterium]